MPEPAKPVLVLLPGMDGTGLLFEEFLRRLPAGIDARAVSYPGDEHLTYPQLAERVARDLPAAEPYVILAESYSGPVAALLAARPVGQLQAVVFVSSFVSFPLGRIGPWIAKVVPERMSRGRAPAWMLRWFLTNSSGGHELIAQVQDATARMTPEVQARRVRNALTADYAGLLRASAVRAVCLLPLSDRLLGTHPLEGFLAARPAIEIVRIAGPHLLLQCAPEDCVEALRKLGLLGSTAAARQQ